MICRAFSRSNGLMLSSLAQRDRQPELMDQPGINAHDHRRALQALRRVNLLCSAVPLIFRSLSRLASDRTRTKPLRVLDVGCGGGDSVIRLARRAQRAGVSLEIHGCDINGTAIETAIGAAQREEVRGTRFFQHDVFANSLPPNYDVTMCTLFLHHFDDAQAIELLRRLAAGASRAVLVDDLLRTRLGYALCWVGCRVVTRSPMVRIDGPLSVRAAFRMEEVEKLADQAGLRGVKFRTHWPQRFLMSWTR